MFLNQIMGQLMRNHNPPISRSLNSSLRTRTLDLPLMQLREEAEITEYTPIRIKRYGTSSPVVENMHCFSREVIHIAYFVEEDGEAV